MSETVDIECPKCKSMLRIHQPLIMRVDNGLMSQVSLVPSWSPDERKCKGCGAMVTPIFGAQLPILWAAMQPEVPEEKRIVIPNPLPYDIAAKIRNGR